MNDLYAQYVRALGDSDAKFNAVDQAAYEKYCKAVDDAETERQAALREAREVRDADVSKAWADVAEQASNPFSTWLHEHISSSGSRSWRRNAVRLIAANTDSTDQLDQIAREHGITYEWMTVRGQAIEAGVLTVSPVSEARRELLDWARSHYGNLGSVHLREINSRLDALIAEAKIEATNNLIKETVAASTDQ